MCIESIAFFGIITNQIIKKSFFDNSISKSLARRRLCSSNRIPCSSPTQLLVLLVELLRLNPIEDNAVRQIQQIQILSRKLNSKSSCKLLAVKRKRCAAVFLIYTFMPKSSRNRFATEKIFLSISCYIVTLYFFMAFFFEINALTQVEESSIFHTFCLPILKNSGQPAG